MSFLKGGLYYASHLTTVSETYAREITSPEFGCGLEACSPSARANELTGILNGIDNADPRVPRTCGAVRRRRSTGKRVITIMCARNSLAARGPLFGLVARLSPKGVDLVLNAETIVNAGARSW